MHQIFVFVRNTGDFSGDKKKTFLSSQKQSKISQQDNYFQARQFTVNTS